jgi:hypothetical protein
MDRRRRPGTPGLTALLLVLAAVLLPSPARASHDAPPQRALTYDVQVRGTVASDVEDFARHAATTFADVRGWSMGGSLGYSRVPTAGSFTLWLAEAGQMTSFSTACSPSYSCRVGRHVVINETRWRVPPPSWTRTLDDYRHYVVLHELGHWLGQGHASCSGKGQPAPVMQQQSVSLQGCTANVWPLAWEREQVARRYGVAVRPDRFSDIAGSVHADAVRRLADAGIAGGFADGTFRPEGPVERGQMAAFLTRARGLAPTGATDFPDIGDSVHAQAVRAVADAGIATGFPDGTFGPRLPVLRGQMATFLARALSLDTSDASCAPPDSAGSTHAGAICAVLRAGLAQGTAGGGFAPADVVSRGQMATFLARAQGLLPRA